MTALEIFQFLTSGGVLAGGVGICKWAFNVEKRIGLLEAKNTADREAEIYFHRRGTK